MTLLDKTAIGKGPLSSKTMYAAALLQVAGLVPGVAPWIAANPQASLALAGLIMAGLRTVTSKPIAWPWSK